MINKLQNFLIIISAPSGAGKTSVVKQILKSEKNFKYSISVTTRNMRKGEIDGVDYFFKTKEEFLKLRDENKLAEWAEVYNNYYGTPIDYLIENINNGYDVILDIDTKGAKQIRENISFANISIFVLPPSLEELKERLMNRKTDSKETVELRLKCAENEIREYKNYDYVVVNDDLDKCVERIKNIIYSEKLRTKYINLNI